MMRSLSAASQPVKLLKIERRRHLFAVSLSSSLEPVWLCSPCDHITHVTSLCSAGVAGPLFSHTINIPISAGDTPEIRDAWPHVARRICVNFCRASFLRLGTVE